MSNNIHKINETFNKIAQGNPQIQKPTLQEQAEYIAVLENTITAIANELGVDAQELINEVNVGGAIKTGYQQGGIVGAIRGGARAIGHNVKQAGQFGSASNNPLDALPTAGSRIKGVVRTAAIKERQGQLKRSRSSTFASKVNAAHSMGVLGDKDRDNKIAAAAKENLQGQKEQNIGTRALDRIKDIAEPKGLRGAVVSGMRQGDKQVTDWNKAIPTRENPNIV